MAGRGVVMEIGYACSFTVDRLLIGEKHVIQPGGPALYATIAAATEGVGPKVYSAVGLDFKNQWIKGLGDLGVDTQKVKRIRNRLTTMFTIAFKPNGRQLYVSNPLFLDDYFRQTKITEDLLYASFTFGEINSDTLRSIVDGREVFVDIQGFTRSSNLFGAVKVCEPRIDFDGIKILKVSDDEATDLKRLIRRALKNGVAEVLVTMGRRGAVVYTEGQVYSHPSLVKDAQAPNTLGAGDVFGSVYFICRTKGQSIVKALSTASERTASFIRGESRALYHLK
jgi:sugar/nucleoside kinase (ribokinase family)